MATKPINRLMNELKPDKTRQARPFSPDISRTAEALLDPGLDEEAKYRLLNEWIASNQPCLFGKMAARANLISYCILSETDLRSSDSHIRNKLQAYRLRWLREAYVGNRSAFVVLAAAPAVADAEPNDELKRLAIRLAELYLLDEVRENSVHRDIIALKMLNPADGIMEWKVGVDFFGMQGDRRWWHNHRIPGGVAFSMNSPGHLVLSDEEDIEDLVKRFGKRAKPKQVVKAFHLPRDYFSENVRITKEFTHRRNVTGPPPQSEPSPRVAVTLPRRAIAGPALGRKPVSRSAHARKAKKRKPRKQ